MSAIVMEWDKIEPPLKVRGNRTLKGMAIQKLLIRGTNWIGDAVMTLPALASVRKTFPEARISILAKPWVADVYRLCPHVDDIIFFESPGRHDGIIGKIRLANELRGRRFDAAILFQNAIEAAIISRLAGIPIRAGFSTDGRGWLLTHAVKRTRAIQSIHQTRYYLEMVKALGCQPVSPDIRLAPERDDRIAAGEILQRLGLADDILIGLAPGATYGAAKKWHPERFAAIADRLADALSARVLLFGSAADRDSTGQVAGHARHPLVDLAGKTNLRDAMAVMACCQLFISNDSGLMHVAAALGIPTVAIFGSTNPVTTGPVGRRTMVVRQGVPCSPCLKTTCPTDFRCMEQITVEDVYAAARRVLE
jgi:heptosyltransferase II